MSLTDGHLGFGFALQAANQLSVVPGDWECGEKVDHADTELEKGVEPVCHSLAGTNVGAESSVLITRGTTRNRKYLQWGILPKTFVDFSLSCQNFDEEHSTSCARPRGFPALEPALGLRHRGANTPLRPNQDTRQERH